MWLVVGSFVNSVTLLVFRDIWPFHFAGIKCGLKTWIYRHFVITVTTVQLGIEIRHFVTNEDKNAFRAFGPLTSSGTLRNQEANVKEDGGWIFNFPFSPFLFLYLIRFFLISRKSVWTWKIRNFNFDAERRLKWFMLFCSCSLEKSQICALHVLFWKTTTERWPADCIPTWSYYIL